MRKRKNMTTPLHLLAMAKQFSEFTCSLCYKLNITHKTDLLHVGNLSNIVNGSVPSLTVTALVTYQ